MNHVRGNYRRVVTGPFEIRADFLPESKCGAQHAMMRGRWPPPNAYPL
jgi:hypothetical protein